VLGAGERGSAALKQAGVAVQGNRRFLMDVPEFNAWLAHMRFDKLVPKVQPSAVERIREAVPSRARI